MSTSRRSRSTRGPDAGAVDELVEYYTSEGFEVESRVEDEIVLARENAWSAVILGALIGGIAQFANPSPRRQRLWLHVDARGQAVVRLHPVDRAR